MNKRKFDEIELPHTDLTIKDNKDDLLNYFKLNKLKNEKRKISLSISNLLKFIDNNNIHNIYIGENNITPQLLYKYIHSTTAKEFFKIRIRYFPNKSCTKCLSFGQFANLNLSNNQYKCICLISYKIINRNNKKVKKQKTNNNSNNSNNCNNSKNDNDTTYNNNNNEDEILSDFSYSDSDIELDTSEEDEDDEPLLLENMNSINEIDEDRIPKCSVRTPLLENSLEYSISIDKTKSDIQSAFRFIKSKAVKDYFDSRKKLPIWHEYMKFHFRKKHHPPSKSSAKVILDMLKANLLKSEVVYVTKCRTYKMKGVHIIKSDYLFNLGGLTGWIRSSETPLTYKASITEFNKALKSLEEEEEKEKEEEENNSNINNSIYNNNINNMINININNNNNNNNINNKNNNNIINNSNSINNNEHIENNSLNEEEQQEEEVQEEEEQEEEPDYFNSLKKIYETDYTFLNDHKDSFNDIIILSDS